MFLLIFDIYFKFVILFKLAKRLQQSKIPTLFETCALNHKQSL